jgi:peptidoglycan/xylan/chitin deacetylase (PgdA/CDA1 family)
MLSPEPVFDLLISRLASFRPWVLLAMLAMLAACSAPAVRTTQVLGQNDRYVVLVAGEGETPARLAKQFLGDAQQAWRIEDANGGDGIKLGQYVVVPLGLDNPVGVFPNGYQTVPVLSYHRFGAGKGKLSVAKRQFEEQMEYLRRNGYRVIPLKTVLAFLRGEAAIPQRSVVLTIDDGYQSVYQIAYPVLKQYGYPATIFIYSDYIGNGGLTWRQMEEMEGSGLISFQAHSKTHDNLTVRLATESIEQYKKRLAGEVRIPAEVLRKRMTDSMLSYAYPFGAVNQPVVEELKRTGYQSGVTVDRGGNAFFTYPYALRRSMIYETDGIDEFKQALRTFESADLQ